MPLPTTTPRTDPIFYDRNGPRTISSLYQEYHAKIKRRASLFVGEESAAEDITSITFFKVLRFAHTFKAGSNFNAWIYRIAGRVTIDYICERMQEPSFPYHPIEESTESGTYGLQEIAEKNMGLPDRLEALMQENVPEPLRATLQLLTFGECTYREIAEILRIPMGTVESRLHRARKYLQPYKEDFL